MCVFVCVCVIDIRVFACTVSPAVWQEKLPQDQPGLLKKVTHHYALNIMYVEMCQRDFEKTKR